ncbi:hypothetical protein [Streptomyces sp. S4.7]|uniref:hypothetical protein n=1 Tax=Streptomyces sp. S4.7 TaxID=2705439 RepID=UPI0013D9FD0A|nr:hypothetical protein [Streptomyces sp. S4.7]
MKFPSARPLGGDERAGQHMRTVLDGRVRVRGRSREVLGQERQSVQRGRRAAGLGRCRLGELLLRGELAARPDVVEHPEDQRALLLVTTEEFGSRERRLAPIHQALE